MASIRDEPEPPYPSEGVDYFKVYIVECVPWYCDACSIIMYTDDCPQCGKQQNPDGSDVIVTPKIARDWMS